MNDDYTTYYFVTYLVNFYNFHHLLHLTHTYLFRVKETRNEDAQFSSIDFNMDSGSTVGLWGRLVRSARPLQYPALAQLLARAPGMCAPAT